MFNNYKTFIYMCEGSRESRGEGGWLSWKLVVARGPWRSLGRAVSLWHLLTSSCREGFPSFITHDRYRLFSLMPKATGILSPFSSGMKLMQNTTRERRPCGQGHMAMQGWPAKGPQAQDLYNLLRASPHWLFTDSMSVG